MIEKEMLLSEQTGYTNAPYDEVSDRLLNAVNDDLLPMEWKPLGRKLGLNESEIESIEHDHCLKYSVKEGSLKMLQSWRNKNAHQANKLLLLCRALNEINRIDIVNTILEKQTTTGQILCDQCSNGAELLLELQDHMVECYKDLELPKEAFFHDRTLFLKKEYVDLTLMTKDRFGRDVRRLEDSIINIKDIFKSSDGTIAKRILVESDPGRGKTVLCLKLLSDWANHVDYIRGRFKMIFNISLKYFREDLSKNLLDEMKGKEEVPDEEKLKLINCESRNVLLILDGFDELNDTLKDKLIRTLKTKEYRNMSVILTCRTGETTVDDSVNGDKCNISETLSFWNKRIEIKGISQDKKEKFVLNYLSGDDLKSYKKFEYLIAEKPSQFSSPLFLLLFVMLLEDREIEEISSRTKFYKKFMNYLVKRELIKEVGINSETTVDVFNPADSSNSMYEGPLLEFGQLALKKLSQNSTTFSSREIIHLSKNVEKKLLRLGVLLRKVTYERHRYVTRYEVCLQGILEFISAFYIAHQLKSVLKIDVENMMNFLKEDGFIYKTGSLFAPFVVGLLRSDAFLFLKFLDSNFSLDQLSDILLELKHSDENLESFLPLNLSHIKSNFKTLLSLNYSVQKSYILSYITHFVFLIWAHCWGKRKILGSHLRLLLHPP